MHYAATDGGLEWNGYVPFCSTTTVVLSAPEKPFVPSGVVVNRAHIVKQEYKQKQQQNNCCEQ